MDKIISEFLAGKNLRKMFSHLCNNAAGQVTDPISDTVAMMITCPVQMIITEVGIALFKDRPTYLYPFSSMDPAQLYFVEEVVRECLLHCDIAKTVTSSSGGGTADAMSLSCSTSASSSCELPFYHLHHHAVVQMGGGCILYMHHHHRNSNLVGRTATSSSSSSSSRKRSRKQLGEQQQHQEDAEDDNNNNQAAAPSTTGAFNGPLLLPPAEVLKAMCDCIFASTTYGNAAVRQSICSIVLQRVLSMTHVISRADQRMIDTYCEALAEAR